MSVPFTSACTVCGEHTHTTRKCHELWADTKEGFYSGGGSNRDYGDEEDSVSFQWSKVLNFLSLDEYFNIRYERRSR